MPPIHEALDGSTPHIQSVKKEENTTVSFGSLTNYVAQADLMIVLPPFLHAGIIGVYHQAQQKNI